MSTLSRMLVVALTLLCIALDVGAAPPCDSPPRLRFSLVPQNDAKKDAEAFRPLLKALEIETGKPIDVIIPISYGSVVEGLVASNIDLAMLGPASYAIAKNSAPDIAAFASYSIKAGAFQEEGPFYRSLLIVRSASKFKTQTSLKGTTLALVDPASTSGAVLPRRLYSSLVKVPLEQFFGRVVYTGGHDRSVLAVANGQVDAAFVSSFLLSSFVSDGKIKKEDYRILWQSELIPLDPFVYRGRLCEPIKETIRKVFLRKNGEEYREALEKLNAIRFSPINDESYRTILESLREPSR